MYYITIDLKFIKLLIIINYNNKMKYDELILSCISCIQEFNPNIEGPDCWAEKFLKVEEY